MDTGPDYYHTTVVIVDCAFRAPTEDGKAVNHDVLVFTEASHHRNPFGELIGKDNFEPRHNTKLSYGYNTLTANGTGRTGHTKGGGKVPRKDENTVDLTIIYVTDPTKKNSNNFPPSHPVINDAYAFCPLYECPCGKSITGACGDVTA